MNTMAVEATAVDAAVIETAVEEATMAVADESSEEAITEEAMAKVAVADELTHIETPALGTSSAESNGEAPLKEQHCAAFNAAAFGIDNDGNVIDASKMKDYKSKDLSQAEWSSIVGMLSKWKTKEQLADLSVAEREQYQAFKIEHKEEWLSEQKQFYRCAKSYDIEEGILANGNRVKRLVRIEKERERTLPRRLVIPVLEVFDVIYNSHGRGHLGIERTQKKLSHTYYSITQ